MAPRCRNDAAAAKGETMSECKAKHTTPDNIPDTHWRCPKCGTDADDGFVIDILDEDVASNCTKLHVDDTINCWPCGYTTTGAKYAAAYRKKAALAPCPHCRGTGYVKAAAKDAPKRKK